MRTIVYERYGPPEVLQLREAPQPTPKADELLIKVVATTAHVGDTRMRRFDVPAWQWLFARLYLGVRKPKRPILGMELAGDVEAVGRDVTQFKAGDAVFGSTFRSDFGAYAEYKCMRADGMLAIKPAGVAYGEAAALPGGGLTALNVLRKAAIQPGQSVLIYGASGSVGTYAVQLAKASGAVVTGVCSTANLAMVESLGADAVIDYTREDVAQWGKAYDVVFDAVDKLPPAQAKAWIKPQGTYLNVRTSSGSDKDLKPEDLVYLAALMEAGKLRTVVDRCYLLEEMVEAHRYVDRGHKKGNVIIMVAPAASNWQECQERMHDKNGSQ
jgi:NADPH:quinone reductase-like Zn-dependent oxidoreductase